MGFVCTAAAEKSNLELIKDSVIIPIGYDDKEPKSYSLLIAFEPMAGGDFEFFFCIIEASHQDNTEIIYWSGLEVAKFASSYARNSILNTLLFGTRRLLNHVAPRRVFCCTHDSHLPEKALRKHLLVVETFKMCGYQVQSEPIQLGKHSWWMDLQE
jgi:hypothetical protein